MSKKYVLILLAVLALTLNACTRAASSATGATPTPDVNFPQPAATSGMNAIEIAGTQTAIATSGLPMPTVADTTVVAPIDGAGAGTPVGVPTFTPLAGINTTPVSNTPLPTPTTGAAAVNTPIPQPAGQSANPGTYTLHAGEFPYCIARRFNVDPDRLLAVNGLSSNQSYYTPGTTLTIPQSGGGFPGPRALIAHPAQYVVRAGDTIYSIACEFGDVDPVAIASANNLGGGYNLTTGTTIQIP